jgi:Raf kinase inhibitor-like YbhB/YbcL family protein
VSPPLKWFDAPDGTKSFALICEDPDAPSGLFTHWIAFNLPPDLHALAEGQLAQATLNDGASQGMNDFGNFGYGGPAPPPGKPHRYYFRLFAVDEVMPVKAGASREQVLTGLSGHTVGEAGLMGTYGRGAT